MSAHRSSDVDKCYTYVAKCSRSASPDGKLLSLQPGDLIVSGELPPYDNITAPIRGRNESTGETGSFQSACLERCIRGSLLRDFKQIPAGTQVLITDLRMQHPGCSFYCGRNRYTQPIGMFYFDQGDDLAVAIGSYSAARDDELNLTVGQIIWILCKHTGNAGSSDWWVGEVSGQAAGAFPSRYVLPLKQVMKELSQRAVQGDIKQVRKVSSNELMMMHGVEGRTVLMMAADSKSSHPVAAKCIKYFEHMGCSPSATDAKGNTAAHLAARNEHLRLLTVLSFESKWQQNDQGRTPLMEAARLGNWRCAKHLVHLLRQERYYSSKVGLLYQIDQSGSTALAIAKAHGHGELADLLMIEQGMRIVSAENCQLTKSICVSPGQVILRNGLLRLAQCSNASELQKKLTIIECDLPDHQGRTMLWQIAQENVSSDAVLNLLLARGDPTCADVAGCSCLHAAVRNGNDEAVRALIEAGVNVNECTEDGVTALMRVASSISLRDGDSVQTAMLLLQAGADWTILSKTKLTALENARERGKSSLIKLLTE